MTILIPYTDDFNKGYELRYAIRSMVKYFTEFSGVLLVGHKPSWYIGPHIAANDYPGRKAYSIYQKMLLGPDQYLFSNDDVFATEPFGLPPLYYTGTLKEAKAHGKHLQRFRNTIELIPDGFSYDLHVPMVIDKAAFTAANNVDWSKERLYRSLYGNYVGGGAMLADNKIRSGFHIPPGAFFSTTERSAKFVKLQELYPEKSEYEY